MEGLLFFTLGESFDSWKEKGLLNREVLPYDKLRKEGISYSFFTYGSNYARPDLDNICGKKSIFLLSFFFPIIYWFKLRKFSFFKTNQMWGSWVPVIASFLTQKPLLLRVGYEHFQYHKFRGSKWYKKLFSFVISFIGYRVATHIIVTSYEMKKYVSSTFKIKLDKISVHYNYIDTNLFKPSIKFTSNDRLLFVGRLVPVKNLSIILKACSRAEVGIDIIGEGPLKDQLVEESTLLGVDASFLGVIPNEQIPLYLNQCMAYILCSDYEGNPKGLLEAMSVEKPVIVSQIPSIEEIIKHEKNGLITDINPESIAFEILRIKKSSSLAGKLGRNARIWIDENASLDSLVSFEKKLLKRIL